MHHRSTKHRPNYKSTQLGVTVTFFLTYWQHTVEKSFVWILLYSLLTRKIYYKVLSVCLQSARPFNCDVCPLSFTKRNYTNDKLQQLADQPDYN